VIRSRFTRRAERELREAAIWIAQDDRSAAEALRSAALRAADLICEKPTLARVRTELAPPRFRFWSLRGFPYLLVCDTRATPAVIVRFVHQSRDLPRALDE